MVIASRGVIGLSTGVNVIARSALSDATTLKERTGMSSAYSFENLSRTVHISFLSTLG